MDRGRLRRNGPRTTTRSAPRAARLGVGGGIAGSLQCHRHVARHGQGIIHDRLGLTVCPVDARDRHAHHVGSRRLAERPHLVYVAQRHGTRQLFRRALDQLDAVPIAGTEGGEFPFFSPGGQWIGFFADNALKKVAAAGGTAVIICPAGFRRGASWGPDGMIVFASGSSPDLMQVAETGGAPKTLTTIAPQTGKRPNGPN